MKNLKISREKAIQLINDDKAIDKGAKLFEQTAEQKKASKQACRAPTAYKFTPREKKANNSKIFIMDKLEKILSEFGENIEVINPEREITFMYENTKYKITLSAPRT